MAKVTKIPVAVNSSNPEVLKKIQLYRKVCAECAHTWDLHFKGCCKAGRFRKCLCGGFVKKPGDSV